MDFDWIEMIPVRVLPENVALAWKLFSTTTDFYNGEITAAISRVNTFAALTGMDANKDKFTNNNENHFGFITLWNWIWNHSLLISFLIGLLLHLTLDNTYSSLCWIFPIVFDFPYMLTGFFKHSYWVTLHYFMSRKVAKMYDDNVWCMMARKFKLYTQNFL
jgi:hypothetical protein